MWEEFLSGVDIKQEMNDREEIFGGKIAIATMVN